MSPHGLKFDGVAVAGIGMVRFGMHKAIPGAHLARDAGLLALHDANMTLADIDEAFVGYIQPASMLGIKAMKEFGLTGLPVTHIEDASATGLVAFRDAAWAVSSGRADVAGYGVAQVDLPEGPRVQSILSGGPDDFAIGMEVDIDLETLRQDSDGNDVVIYRFRPASDAATTAVGGAA